MRNTSRDLEVCIVKPTSFEDSQQVCEVLLDGRACVVNLEGFDADDAQRIMDFISGCIFAIDGKLHRISKYIFIFAPSNIDISGDYLDLLPDDKKNTLTINKQF
jgi:cell division inhibitor SepF